MWSIWLSFWGRFDWTIWPGADLTRISSTNSSVLLRDQMHTQKDIPP